MKRNSMRVTAGVQLMNAIMALPVQREKSVAFHELRLHARMRTAAICCTKVAKKMRQQILLTQNALNEVNTPGEHASGNSVSTVTLTGSGNANGETAARGKPREETVVSPNFGWRGSVGSAEHGGRPWHEEVISLMGAPGDDDIE